MFIFSFQINLILTSQYKLFYDLVMASLIFSLFLITNRWSVRYVGFFIIFFCVGLLYDDILKWVYLAISFYFGYLLISRYKERVLLLLTLVVFFNFIILGLQLLGVNEIFYKMQNYYPNFSGLQYVDLFIDNDGLTWAPLSQFRPSGIFPSTIYLTFFQFFLVSYFFSGTRYAGRFFYFLLSLFFALSGSSASMLLVIGVYLFGGDRRISRWFIYGYVISLILYYIMLPSYFFEYNYSYEGALLSISSRFILVSAMTDNGFANLFNIYISFVMGFILLLFLYTGSSVLLLYAGSLDLRRTIFICMLVIGPLIIHPSVTIPFYWFFVGCVFGYCVTSGETTFKKKSRSLVRGNLRKLNSSVSGQGS